MGLEGSGVSSLTKNVNEKKLHVTMCPDLFSNYCVFPNYINVTLKSRLKGAVE